MTAFMTEALDAMIHIMNLTTKPVMLCAFNAETAHVATVIFVYEMFLPQFLIMNLAHRNYFNHKSGRPGGNRTLFQSFGGSVAPCAPTYTYCV
jgi:hypothetical protein